MTRRLLIVISILIIVSSGLSPKAKALPSYARQTGLACNGCHYTPPELNPAGRLFKVLAYVDRTKSSNIEVSEGDKRRPGLEMLQTLPLGAWFETSFTSTKSTQSGTQNGNFEFPQDVSLFLAGGWAAHVGSFLQVTYNAQKDHFSMDNTDIRYAQKLQLAKKEFVYGLTLNNNPTVEDLWNTTPVWGYPFIASDSAPTPAAATIITSLGQDVAGFGGYSMYDQHLYIAGTIYRTDHIGSSQPTNGQNASHNIRGVAPYWRAAWQNIGSKNMFEVGAYGMHVSSTPGALSGPKDTYTDYGPDVQYDRTIGRRDVLSVRGTYLRENSTLNATLAAGGASQAAHHLDTGNANVEYHFGSRIAAEFGAFLIGGTTDPVLRAPAAQSGSANGSPRTVGFITNFSVWPKQNIDLAVQYTAYSRFNGGSNNYDGSGRNASDNNTLYLLTRFVF